MEYTTQRVSKENVEQVNEIIDGRNFDQKLEKMIRQIEKWDEDLIEQKIQEEMQKIET